MDSPPQDCPPPPPIPEPVELPGQLSQAWRATLAIVWALAFVALIAVWKTSVEIGIHTWWLGPFGSPAPFVVRLLPFVPSLAMLALVIANSRFLPFGGIVGALALFAVGLGDSGEAFRLGVVEFGIAGACLVASIASFGGRYVPLASAQHD